MCQWRRSCLVMLSVGIAVAIAPAGAAAQVIPGTPFETSKVLGSIPVLPGASGPLPSAPINTTTPDDVHEGVFTWGLDLINPIMSSQADWLNHIYPTPPLNFAYTAAPKFIVRLGDEALVSAGQHLAALDAGGVGKVFEAFDLLPGKAVQIPASAKQLFQGYKPVRARWLKNRWAPTGQVFWMVEGKVTYADYFPFEDVRLRGARAYCAARRVQFVQGGNARSLGERVGFSVSLLGQTIDFLVVEPTVALDGPSKFLAQPVAGGAPDGAQAFSIPFAFGTRVTPIRGLGLPPLGEARVPVVLVTGDTEVVTGTNKRLIYEIGKGGLVSQNVFSREYHTVTHADAMLAAGFHSDQKFYAEKEVPFFLIGPLVVKGLIRLDYEVGKPTTPTDDRVLQLAPWPNTARVGHLYQNPGGVAYHDGAWLLGKKRQSPFAEWQVQPEGTTDPFWTDPIVTLSPTDLRALTNDDHSLRTSTSLGLSLGLGAELGVSAGPFDVSAKVKGSVTGTVAQHHVVRDALMAEALPPGFVPAMVPATTVTVKPQQTASVQFDGMTAGLHFHLDLLFGSINFDKTFFSLPSAVLADYNSATSWDPADERYMLRMGTGSALGSPMTKPGVFSHLPGGEDFPTFVTDVAACLADETPAPELNEPCTVPPDNGAPPKVNVCVYGPSLSLIEKLGSMDTSLPSLPAQACASPGGWPSGFGMSDALKECFGAYLQLLCQPVSTQQAWEGQSVVSHVWNFDADFGWALKGVIQQCQAAFLAPDVPVTPEFNDIVAELMAVGPCADDATLIPGDAIFQAVSPTTAPTAQPGASCAQ